jgi:hypothetical protein
MNLDFLFSHLLFAPSAAPYGLSSEDAGCELDDSNWSAMHMGDWLAANEVTMHPRERPQDLDGGRR